MLTCLKHGLFHYHFEKKNFRWLQEINNNCENVGRILVGNKCDDLENRVVAYEDALRVASQIGMQYLETSAEDNINIEETFQAITESALKAKKPQMNELAIDKAENVKIHVVKDLKNEQNEKCC